MRWLPARAHDSGLFLVYSNGVGVDDNEIRTGVLSLRKPMILDPYGRILAETWKAGDDMVVADLDASLLEVSTGKRWIKTRRPELYKPLTIPTGREFSSCSSKTVPNRWRTIKRTRARKKASRNHVQSLRCCWSVASMMFVIAQCPPVPALGVSPTSNVYST